MRYNSSTPRTLALLLFLSTLLLAATPLALAAANATFDEEDDAGYEETARVVRVSLIRGDVSLRRAGSKSWEKATLNLPLVEGDRLATGADARLEIQIDARNFIRLGEYATLDIITLRDAGIALSLPEGTATLRLAGFDDKREYFEIDAPKTTLAAEQKGSYRLDVAQNGNVRVTVRDGGRARLYSETSGFTLRDGRTAELAYNETDEDGDWELTTARGSDNWDAWIDERESYLASRLRYDRRNRYYDESVWGAEELDSYGDWVNSGEYGYVWRPHVTVINNYNNWAPYRYGSWRWVSPYGWTWVGDEPWGWAPYHYGRWVYSNNYWAWAPRGYAYYGHRRSYWRPALVAFVNINIGGGGGGYYGGEHVAWYPLGYHQRDPRSNFFRRAANRAREGQRIANLDRVNPIYQRAVTTLPTREFGKGFGRGQPATKELALRAITADPVRGKLAVRPDETAPGTFIARPVVVGRDRKAGGDSALVIRNPTDPSIAPVERRKTGAAKRLPGLALDDELRRGRIYNNREPRSIKADKRAEANNGGGGEVGGNVSTGNNGERVMGNNGERGTGAVARPARPIRRLPDTRDGVNGVGDNGGANGVPAMKRPARQDDPNAETLLRPRPGVRDGEERPARKVKPVERERRNDDTATPPQPDYNGERPTTAVRPEGRNERAKPVERERPAPEVYRPRPEVREERKTQREERPEPHYERPAPPPSEERPAPREERSAPREERHAPTPREERRPDPPPQREERRPDPPRQREESPAVRQRTRPIDND